ncbi:uncharacterized protein LOC105382808 [Plutella xylostella]|uniref:uncharacterized protein LOC105382808 n=1 Tax=Plutella xylostella TaxID=51655 RepID=UPI002032C991|nr:uncharacterized protein LOC105382808 [Plutella xylostella]
MSDSFNLDIASDSVKNIVDSLRCFICDKLEGGRVRYPCGDGACVSCAECTPYCPVCSPPVSCAHDPEPAPDPVLARRAQHAAELLSAFQDTFHVNVLNRHRISEQLKREKELFPDCIQGSNSYHNKHKRDITLYEGKANSSPCKFPGEVVDLPHSFKMDSSKNTVQEWLDQHESELFECKPRKPFADLKVNSPKYKSTPIKKRSDLIMDKVENIENVSSKKARKRSHFKSALSAHKSQSLLDKYMGTSKPSTSGWKSVKRAKTEFDKYDKPQTYNSSHKKHKDESGICLDDETIVIEDSQSVIVDKDKLAWLAVLEANENESSYRESASRHFSPEACERECYVSVERMKTNNAPIANAKTAIEVANKKQKVPFFMKSSLVQKHKVCDDKLHVAPEKYKFKDVSITVESKSLITTITVSKCDSSKASDISMVSKLVQTDDSGFNDGSVTSIDESKRFEKKAVNAKVDNSSSEDIFTAEPVEVAKQQNISSIVIDSSSDSEQEEASIIVVTADVHRSNDHIKKRILREIPVTENRPRPPKRGCSPQSSGSSDKENRDPNTMKKIGADKKIVKKKPVMNKRKCLGEIVNK